MISLQLIFNKSHFMVNCVFPKKVDWSDIYIIWLSNLTCINLVVHRSFNCCFCCDNVKMAVRCLVLVRAFFKGTTNSFQISTGISCSMTAFTTTFITEAINYDKINGTFIWFTKKTKLLDSMSTNILTHKVFFSIIHLSTNKTFFPLKHLSHWLNCQCIFQYKSIWNFRNWIKCKQIINM